MTTTCALANVTCITQEACACENKADPLFPGQSIPDQYLIRMRIGKRLRCFNVVTLVHRMLKRPGTTAELKLSTYQRRRILAFYHEVYPKGNNVSSLDTYTPSTPECETQRTVLSRLRQWLMNNAWHMRKDGVFGIGMSEENVYSFLEAIMDELKAEDSVELVKKQVILVAMMLVWYSQNMPNMKDIFTAADWDPVIRKVNRWYKSYDWVNSPFKSPSAKRLHETIQELLPTLYTAGILDHEIGSRSLVQKYINPFATAPAEPVQVALFVPYMVKSKVHYMSLWEDDDKVRQALDSFEKTLQTDQSFVPLLQRIPQTHKTRSGHLGFSQTLHYLYTLLGQEPCRVTLSNGVGHTDQMIPDTKHVQQRLESYYMIKRHAVLARAVQQCSRDRGVLSFMYNDTVVPHAMNIMFDKPSRSLFAINSHGQFSGNFYTDKLREITQEIASELQYTLQRPDQCGPQVGPQVTDHYCQTWSQLFVLESMLRNQDGPRKLMEGFMSRIRNIAKEPYGEFVKRLFYFLDHIAPDEAKFTVQEWARVRERIQHLRQ